MIVIVAVLLLLTFVFLSPVYAVCLALVIVWSCQFVRLFRQHKRAGKSS